MIENLSVYQNKSKNSIEFSDFNKWKEITHIYTITNLLPKHFDTGSKKLYKFQFTLRNSYLPLSVYAENYKTARLRFHTAFRQKKQIKHLKFEHDRIFSRIEISEPEIGRPIGLSKVSSLQQNYN